MRTLEEITGINKNDIFFEEIRDNWQTRAKKLRERRWRAMIAKDRKNYYRDIKKEKELEAAR